MGKLFVIYEVSCIRCLLQALNFSWIAVVNVSCENAKIKEGNEIILIT